MIRFKNLFLSNAFFGRILLLFLILVQILKGIYPAMTDIRSDFPNYYVSSKLLLEKKDLSDLYSNQRFNDHIHEYGIRQDGKFAPFPPPTAFIMLPIAGLQPMTAKIVWTIINIFLLFGVIRLFKKISGFNLMQSSLLTLSMGIALFNNFYLGQVYLLILIFWMLAFVMDEKTPFVSGGLLAAGISIKYFPAISFFSLISEKKWKVIGGLLAGILIIAIFSIIIIGIKPCSDFIKTVFFSHLNGKLEGQIPYASAFQSWNSLALNLFVKHPVINPQPFIDLAEGAVLLKILVLLVLLFVLINTLYKLRKNVHFGQYSLVLISLFAFAYTPVSASYHLLLLLFPLALLIRLQKDNERLIAIVICFVLLFGFSGLLFDQINSHISFLPFRFYRLILLNVFFVIIAGSIRKSDNDWICVC